MKLSNKRIGFVTIGATVIGLLLLFLVAHDSLSVPLESSKPVSPAPGRSPEKGSKSLSNRPADLALAREIDRVIDESDLTQARWGVFVTSLTDGRIIYSRDGDKL